MFQKKNSGQIIYLIFFILLTISFHSYSQAMTNSQEIDSLIGQRIKDTENLKKFRTFIGQLRVYKKILGIKIRIKKGEEYQEDAIYKNSLLYHRNVSIFPQSYGNDFESENYYYIDNKFVKYHMSVKKRDKESNVFSIKDNQIAYIDNENIIYSETKSQITKTTLEYIYKQAKAYLKLNWYSDELNP